MCEKNSFHVMDKLAALYQVPVTDLLDDYNRFLCRGQGRQISALRESKGMTIAQFAEHLGVYTSTVLKWEKDQARITRRMWDKLVSLK